MGVEGSVFSPLMRSSVVREQALGALGLGPDATLLIGVGRFSAEKRWSMVLRAMSEVSRHRKVGMLLVGDGSKRARLELQAERIPTVAVLPRITDREELARLIASADALVHGCEAETFCMVAAEARASGIPLIVPDRGAAIDQLVPGAGKTYRAANQISLERAIGRFIDRGPELQRAVAVRSCRVRTMDEHFADLFARYQTLVPQHAVAPAARLEIGGEAAGELALARTAAGRS
jgi:alpha-1,6-mannosyltransferase